MDLPESGPSPEQIAEALDAVRSLGLDGGTKNEPFDVRDGTISLRAKSVPPHLIADIETAYPRPRPPKVDVTRSGIETYEINSEDPEFLQALRDWQVQIEIARQRALFAMGLVIDEVREGALGPHDDWDAELLVADLPGVRIPGKQKPGRFLAWLLYYALRTSADIAEATVHSMRMVGTSEKDVAAAVRMFPADEARPTGDAG